MADLWKEPALTHSRPEIHRLLDEHGLRARRELGQNFVADPNTVRRIASIAGVATGDHVIEVGPGLGSLTLALAETGASVTAIEVDAGLASALEAQAIPSVTVIHADAQALDWTTVRPSDASRTVLVANLPYNIGTTLILDTLEKYPFVSELTVLVQTEVAERLAARVGTKAYGIPSVMAALYADRHIAASVPPTVFVPKPKVDSAVIRLIRHREPPVDVSHADLAAVVRAGFGQRRKMIRRSLGALLDEHQIAALRIDPTARAETLELEEWAALAKAASGRIPND